MTKCDIIIPIYNAFDCLKECIDSVLRNTDFKTARLILIDDKSPDERVLPLLKKYQEENPDKIVLIENEENVGFVQTTNKGMHYSDRDVLLLNSDTRVPEGWLGTMMKCAYADESIATVTPLSNNTTPVKLPESFREKGYPDGYSFDEMAKVVSEHSAHLYPEIPSAHGFCMYIKRAALDKVGYFDEKTFGKGYGEENDFCFRCLKYGYRHILCDDVYVLHKGAQSFGKKKFHNKELLKKHPLTMRRVGAWYAKSDANKVIENILLAIGTRDSGRGNVLILAEDSRAVEKWREDKLRSNHNIHLFYPERGTYKVYSLFKDVELATAVFERPATAESYMFYSSDYEKNLEETLKDLKVSLVIVEDITVHSFDVGRVCKKLKIDYVLKSNPELKEIIEEGKIDYPSYMEEYKKLEQGAKDTKGYEKLIKTSKLDFSRLQEKVLKYNMILNIINGESLAIPARIIKRSFVEKCYLKARWILLHR